MSQYSHESSSTEPSARSGNAPDIPISPRRHSVPTTTVTSMVPTPRRSSLDEKVQLDRTSVDESPAVSSNKKHKKKSKEKKDGSKKDGSNRDGSKRDGSKKKRKSSSRRRHRSSSLPNMKNVNHNSPISEEANEDGKDINNNEKSNNDTLDFTPGSWEGTGGSREEVTSFEPFARSVDAELFETTEAIEFEGFPKDGSNAFLESHRVDNNTHGLFVQEDFQQHFLLDDYSSPSQRRHQRPPSSSTCTKSIQTPPTAATTARTEYETLSPQPIVAFSQTAAPALVRQEQQQPLSTATVGKATDDVGDFAREQGERFQDYLKASGQMDEKLAAATAEAFQAFLSSHVPQSSSATESPAAIMAGQEIGVSSFIDDVSELGNSVMGGDWDNGTFVSFSTQEHQERQQRQQKKLVELQMDKGSAMNHPGGDEWGEIKRNESFVRRRASLTHVELRPPKEPMQQEQQRPLRDYDAINFPPQPQPQEQQLPFGDNVGIEFLARPSVMQQQRYFGNNADSFEFQNLHPQPRPLGDYAAIVGETCPSHSSSASISTNPSVSTSGLERTFHEQWLALSKEERSCVLSLKKKWERHHRDQKYADKWYLQFARCSPGKPFTYKTAYKVMKSTKRHLIDICGEGMTDKMEAYLLTKTMFPCAGLKTKEGLDVNYIRPSRYFPSKRPILFMKEISCYIMNHRLEKEENCLKGICVLVNMKGWNMRNFSMAYCYMVCLLVQGFTFPTRVAYFMFVDSPAWFGSIWSIMRPMLAPSFRRRVLFLKTSQMPDYFAPGFERFLPDDMYGGQANTDDIIHNFIAERKRIDEERRADTKHPEN